MIERKNVPIQSMIDHIKTAVDVDPWAKEMAEELLKEQEETKTIICPKCGDEIEIKWSLLIKSDMEAIAKRDAFLSEENGKKRKGCNHVSSKKKKQLV